MADDVPAPESPKVPVGWETAPVINFEIASTWGIHAQGGRITLETRVLVPYGPNDTRAERRVVAHLQGSGSAFITLYNALKDMGDMAAGPAPGDPVN